MRTENYHQPKAMPAKHMNIILYGHIYNALFVYGAFGTLCFFSFSLHEYNCMIVCVLNFCTTNYGGYEKLQSAFLQEIFPHTQTGDLLSFI